MACLRWLCMVMMLLAIWPASAVSAGGGGASDAVSKPEASEAHMIDQGWIAQGDCAATNSVCDWQPVTLPDHWGIRHRQGVWTYRLQLPVASPLADGEPHALWLPRAGDRLTLWLNGEPLSQLGRIDAGQDSHAHQPLWLPVSQALLRKGDNELRIVVASSYGRLPGLSRVRWGPASALLKGYQVRNHLVIGGAVSTAILSALGALIGVGVAWRTRNLHAWLFALCSALWTVREILRMLVTPWPDPVGWYAITVGSFGVTVMAGSWLQLLLMQPRRRWMYALMLTVLAALPWAVIEAYQTPARHAHIFTAWMMAAMSVGTITTVLACWHFVRHPSASNLVSALGCVGCVALSVTDNWMFFLSGNPMGYEHIAVTSYMGISLMFGVSAAVFLRVDRAIKLEAMHKTELERQVEAQRQELQALHAREQTRAREQAVADERARMMQDMHDGLGSRLVGLMSTVQSGKFTREELAQDLSEAMDELRLTLDSLSSAGDDLSSLLGQLRFRLAPRWRKLGIHLDWQVDELPTRTGLGPSELASLQRLLHEVFSNILKHARASRVQVRAFTDTRLARHVIEISDDGIGFDAAAPVDGHGLSNMARRVKQLSGALQIEATPGHGTHIRIELPLGPVGMVAAAAGQSTPWTQPQQPA